eukprot:5102088-Heterocapsa_arctica.AAC.1
MPQPRWEVGSNGPVTVLHLPRRLSIKISKEPKLLTSMTAPAGITCKDRMSSPRGSHANRSVERGRARA